MKIKTITYKRIHNLGNYNTEHLEMMAELDDNEDIQEKTNELILTVNEALGINKPPVEKPKVYDNVPY